MKDIIIWIYLDTWWDNNEIDLCDLHIQRDWDETQDDLPDVNFWILSSIYPGFTKQNEGFDQWAMDVALSEDKISKTNLGFPCFTVEMALSWCAPTPFEQTVQWT